MNRRTLLLAKRGLAILKQRGNHPFPFLDPFLSIYTLREFIYNIKISNIHASNFFFEFSTTRSHLSISSFCFSFLLCNSSSNVCNFSRSSLTSWSSRLWRRWGLGDLRRWRGLVEVTLESLAILLISKWLKSLEIVLFNVVISSGPGFLAWGLFLKNRSEK